MARSLSRRYASAAALLGYAAVSLVYFGWPVHQHPERLLIGTGGDPQIFVWAMAWWPHAILHGQNPFVTHAVWAPDGLNLAWTTTIPLVSFALSPLTLAFGPDLSYNAAAVLLPALAAWTCFLLLRHVTRSFWAAIVGGYLFGFSSFMLGQELGHMHLTSAFLVPVIALMVLRFVEGELTSGGLAWRLGLLLGLQTYLSIEVLFTISFFLVLALAAAFWLAPERRSSLRRIPRPLVGGYLLAGVVAAPLLVYALLGFQSGAFTPPQSIDADLANFVVPTRLIAIGGGAAASLARRFPANDAERGAYLGLPIVLIVAWYAWRARRRPAGRFLVLAVAFTILCALGTDLWVAGHRLVPLPWDLLSKLPVFNNVQPARLTFFLTLATSTIVALWLADSRIPAWIRAVLAAAAIAALFPALGRS